MIPAPLQLIPILAPLLIAVFALVMAAFPRQMTRWQMRGPAGTTRIEPSRMRVLMMRIMGVVVAGFALIMAYGASTVLP